MTATAPAAPAKVYFTNLRTHARESQLDKLKRLIRHAGIEQIDFENKFVAIKIHFGELGNLSFLRPNYARAVADVVKELGGKPFLTDCNTLYVGSRKNALEHIDTAYQNGFTPYATGCQIIIADGLKGNDEAEVPVRGGEYVEKARIGRAVMDADVFISLSHFKGHEEAGFGGTLKNTQAHEMGGLVCKALMERTGLAPELVEEVVIAQVKQNAVASNIARVCALMAGFREEIPAYTLMMQCGSSLQSVNCIISV